jgi:ketosteroid isomerase-like protein
VIQKVLLCRETLRRLFALVGEGENPEALYELLDPNVVFIVPPNFVDAGRHVGHDAVRRYFRRWVGTWESWHVHPESLIDTGDDQVVVDAYERARGKGSGVEVETRLGQLWIFRDGLVVRWENFASLAEALEAAGLSE